MRIVAPAPGRIIILASRLLLYKTTHNLLHWTGDTGAFLRSTMQSMVLFGMPPEDYWPYVIADYEKEPSAFCYAFAQNYQTIQYVRLDPSGTTKAALLQNKTQAITLARKGRGSRCVAIFYYPLACGRE